MKRGASRAPGRFPAVPSGQRIGLILLLSLAGLTRAAAGAGLGLCVGDALGAGATISPGRWIPTLSILVVASFALRLLESRLAEQLAQSFVSQVRLRMLEAIGRLRQPTPGNGMEHLPRLVSDLGSLRNWVSQGFALTLSGGVSLASLLTILLAVDVHTFCVCAGGTVLVALAGAALTPLIQRSLRIARRARGRVSHRLWASSLDRDKDGDGPSLGRLQRRLGQAAVRNSVLTTCLRRLPELMQGMVLIGLVALSVSSLHPVSSPGHPVTLLLFLGLVTAALRDLVQAWIQRLVFVESRRRIQRLLRRGRNAHRESESTGVAGSEPVLAGQPQTGN